MARGPFHADISRYRSKRIKGRKATIYRHRAEAALGKPLPPGTQVHHADGSRNDDAPLVICQDFAYHQLLHIRMRVVRAGGNPNTERICAHCKQLKPLAAFTRDNTRPSGLQRICQPCCDGLNRESYVRRLAAKGKVPQRASTRRNAL